MWVSFLVSLFVLSSQSFGANLPLLQSAVSKVLPGLSGVCAPRSGPLSAVFRAQLESPSKKQPSSPHLSIGTVFYSFTNYAANLQGYSTQHILACRCLPPSCTRSIVIRPVSSTNPPSCIYPSVNGRFLDCHATLLHLSTMPSPPNPSSLVDAPLSYAVNDAVHDDFWKAKGTRSRIHNCSTFTSLPLVHVSSIQPSELISPPMSLSLPEGCASSDTITFHRDATGAESRTCATALEQMSAKATFQAGLQDCIAVGKTPTAFFSPVLVPLVSDTDLALASTAALLGIFFLASSGLQARRNWGRVVVLQIFAFILEGLPLHFAVSQEVRARKWEGGFGFLDACAGGGVQGVVSFVSVVGKLRLASTRVGLLLGVMGLLDGIAVAVVGATIWRGLSRNRKRADKRCREMKGFLSEGAVFIGIVNNTTQNTGAAVCALNSRNCSRQLLSTNMADARSHQLFFPSK